MANSFNPHPMVAVTKAVVVAALIIASLFYIRESIADILFTAIIAVVLSCIAYILLAVLVTKFHTITLEEQTITYHSGIISTRKIVLPYAKITEASYTQGLTQRIFGVGTLRVDTAGGADVAIHMADVRYADLKKILDEINKKSGKDGGI